jgi:hypothetical protein
MALKRENSKGPTNAPIYPKNDYCPEVIKMAGRPITTEEKAHAVELLARARKAQKQVENYDQKRVDHLCRGIGWATSNEKIFARIAVMGVDESGLGDPVGRVNKRFKIMAFCAMF